MQPKSGHDGELSKDLVTRACSLTAGILLPGRYLAIAPIVLGACLGRFAWAAGEQTSVAGGLSMTASTQPRLDQESAAGDTLEEVVVTAEYRSERLQDTPISISAFSQDRLDVQGVRDVDDLSRLTPGISFQRIGETAASNYNDENSDLAIRGIDSSAGSSTTGVYIDDTPIQTRHLGFGDVNAFPALFDLDRVEVLRGPQGTLFGGGSEGGTIRFITPDPGLSAYSGYFRGELAFTDNGAPSYETAAALGGPIVEGTLGFRASASFRTDGGYVDRVNYDPTTQQALGISDRNSNWEQTKVFRIAMQWAPTDSLTVMPSFIYQQLYLNDTSAFWPSLSVIGKGILYNGNAQRDTSLDPFYLPALKTVWHGSEVTVTSNTSAFIRNQSTTSDYTQFDRAVFAASPYPAPGDAGTAYFKDSQRNFTEEFRVQSNNSEARLIWTAGLFASYISESDPEQIYDPNLASESGGALAPTPGGFLADLAPLVEIDRTVALYGQADYKLIPTLKATLGVRVSYEETAGEQFLTGPFIGPASLSANGHFSDAPVTPKFGLSYNPDRDHLYYVSIAKGYRQGGINLGLGSVCASGLEALGLTTDPLTYRPDSLWSYEIGTKTSFQDGRLQLDSSVFYINWKNIQQNVYIGSCGEQFADNLGAAVSRGGEISVNYRPAHGLLLGIEGGYTDARYTRTVYAGQAGAGSPIVTRGDLLTPVPWTLDGSLEYDLPAVGGSVPYARLDYQHAAAQDGHTPYQDSNNGSFDTTIPGTPETNNLMLRGGFRLGGLDVSAFANNVLNSLPILVTSRDTTASPLYFERTWRPRTIGVTTTYRF